MNFRPCLFLLALAALARGESTTASVAFSDPSKPKVVKIFIAHGELRLQGDDSNSVVVTSDAKTDRTSERRNDGLRVVSSSTGFNLTEKENIVELNYGRDGDAGRAEFRVTVPRSAAVQIVNGWGGEISVADISGDIEVQNMNGKVTLTGLGGGASVETMNGEIAAHFTQLTAKALSFSTMNGEISLQLPSTAKANVRFRTQNGAVLTNFDEEALKVQTTADTGKTKRPKMKKPALHKENADLSKEIAEAAREASRAGAEMAREAQNAARQIAQAAREGMAEAGVIPMPPLPPIPPVTGGKLVSGTLNGGGIELQATTMNGDIVVRHSVAK